MRQKARQALIWISLVCCGIFGGYYIGRVPFRESPQLMWEPNRHAGPITGTASKMSAREQINQVSNSNSQHSSIKKGSSASTQNADSDVKDQTRKTKQPEWRHESFNQHEKLTQNKTIDELLSIPALEKPSMAKFVVNGKLRFKIFPEPLPLESVEVEPSIDVFGKKQLPFRECIHLSVVVCGSRTTEALVMLKSAAILSHTCLVFHVFAEDKLQEGIRNELNTWPIKIRNRITLYVYPITYPSSVNRREWKEIFKPCATQRIFIPELLPIVDTVLYVDTDILFISPIENIWQYITSFNSTQFAGLAPTHEIPSVGWYNRIARQPYYGKLGLNSGVMLLNLTRMRNFKWSKRLVPIYRQYKDKILLGDQDLINVELYFHSDTVFEISCEWNYRPDHCESGNNCRKIETDGMALLHGTTGIFHSPGPFGAIFDTYKDYEFGSPVWEGLIQPLKEKFINMKKGNCIEPIRDSVLATLSAYT